MTRGRFAPTPSGQLHIGNLYAALLAWLQARSERGTFMLRIEDIDRPRSKPQWAAQIVDDLRWLGIDWDEGPDVGGPYGPYSQSEREEDYRAAMERLLRDGWLYPCYCSRADLMSLASAPHGLDSEGPAYPGICRRLTAAERAEKTKRPSYRFAMPGRAVRFDDLIVGPQQFPAGAGGDFVVQRSDGIIGYQLAVVVDDAAMGITDVVRGFDLLDSTPRQLLLYEALSLEPPRFAHVPLIHGPDGSRLSKRDRSLAAVALRERGVPPERLIGYIASWLGLHDRPEPMRAADLIQGFAIENIQSEPIIMTEEDYRTLAEG